MNCPSCNQPPMSLRRWLITFDPLHVQCMHCATKLIPAPSWRKKYYWTSTVATLIVIMPTLLVYFGALSLNYLMPVFYVAIGLVPIILVSLAAFFWKRFEYQKEVERSQ